MATPDISKLRRTMVYSWELFYEPQTDGTRILRHIRVNNTRYEVPADGITVDIPNDSVGTEQIIDKSITLDDISDKEFATDADIQSIFEK